MGAAEALGSSDGISLHDLRPLVGAEVAAETVAGAIEGMLLSCTSRSAWIVVGDLDHVVPLPHLVAIQRR
jgi:maleate cis-trans isomerase